jgi:hypothetical protein
MQPNERLLQYIWQYQKFDPANLQTTQGQAIYIQQLGYLNTNAGPDFLEAKVLISNVLWAGQIELHVQASHWHAHAHESNPAYQNVILHVVWEADKQIFDSNHNPIPTLELKSRVDATFLIRYQQLMENKQPIPCYNSFDTVNSFQKIVAMEQLLIQRLQHKAEYVLQILDKNNGDWEQTAFVLLARGMGFGLNALPMERLAAETPLKHLLKNDNLLATEAMLFGQAGMLGGLPDPYARQLQAEYNFWKAKYQLNSSIQYFEWKFMRLRPNNFPTKRIAELAQLIHKNGSLFSKFLFFENNSELKAALQLPPHAYWQNHVNFSENTQKQNVTFGADSANLLIINVVVPIIAAYSIYKAQPDFMDKAIDLLLSLPPENNRITRFWKNLNLEISNAAQSQAAIEWYNNLCMKKQCLSCSIAHSLLAK